MKLTEREILRILDEFLTSDLAEIQLNTPEVGLRLVRRSDSVDGAADDLNQSGVRSSSKNESLFGGEVRATSRGRNERVQQVRGSGWEDRADNMRHTEEGRLGDEEAPLDPNSDTQSSKGLVISSPVVGVFYRRPSPEAEPYIQVGASVNPETIVGTIEIMKMFTEIPAGVSGVIADILVENGQMVEHGQPLMIVSS